MEELLIELGAEFPPSGRSQGSGDWRYIHCPLCDSRRSSAQFSDELVDDDGNLISKFWCPVCGFSGDQFDLVIAAGKAKNFRGAMAWLTATFDLGGHATKRPELPPEPAYPDDWPPREQWGQEHWAWLFNRWMPVARAAIVPKDQRTSLGAVYQLVRDLDELDAELRGCIYIAVDDNGSPEAARFSTFLQLIVRRRVMNFIRNRIRAERLGVSLDEEEQDVPESVAKFEVSEVQWAQAMDWGYALETAAKELSPAHADYASLRATGFKMQEIADTLGLSRNRVRLLRQEFRDWYRSVRGREVTVYREVSGGGTDRGRPGPDAALPDAPGAHA